MKNLNLFVLFIIQFFLIGSFNLNAKELKSSEYNSPQGSFFVIITETKSIMCSGEFGELVATVFVNSGPVTGLKYNWSGGGNSKVVLKQAGTYTITVTSTNSPSKTATYILSEPDEISISGLEIIDGCNGGNGQVLVENVEGGREPYEMHFINTNTNTKISKYYFYSGESTKFAGPAGNYTIKIIDKNKCVFNQSLILRSTTKAFTNAGIVPSPVSCYQSIDGKYVSTPEQIIPGVTKNFDWVLKDVNGIIIDTDCCNPSSSKDDLKAGTYTLEITMDQCLCPKLVKSFTITQPTQLVFSGQKTDVDCFSNATGNIILTTSGGNGGYKYEWNTGATSKDLIGLKIGSYHVSVTDSKNCKSNPSSLSFTINQPDIIENSGFVIKDVLCFSQRNGEIIQNIKGGISPYSYSWVDGSLLANRDQLLKGMYSCKITDKNKCISNFNYIVNEPKELIQSVDTILPYTSMQKGAITINVTGGFGQYFFDWSGPNGYKASSEDIFDLMQGDYTLSIQDENGCVNEKKYTVPLLTSASDNEFKSVYFIQYSDRILFKNIPIGHTYTTRVIKADGSLILGSSVLSYNGELQMDTKHLSSGIYFVQLSNLSHSYSFKVNIF